MAESVPETRSKPVLASSSSPWPDPDPPSTSSSSSTTSGLSAAQLRQERIRRKVLANQGERLKTVLGPSATDDDIKNLLKSQSLPGVDDDQDPRITAFGASNVTNEPSSSLFAQSTPQSADQVPAKPPLISVSTQRYILCLVGAMLSILVPSTTTLGWNNFLIYFALLELIIWFFVKGGSVTNASNQAVPIALTMFLVLINKPGLKEPLKLGLELWRWLWVDFCCFSTSLFIVQIILSYIFV